MSADLAAVLAIVFTGLVVAGILVWDNWRK